MNKMYCDHCGEREATFFYEENKFGVVNKMRLCSHCAAAMGFSQKNENPFFSFPLFFEGKKEKSEKTCPNCKMTLSSVQRGGKFGCSACYDTFSPLLDLTPFIGSGYGGRKAKSEEKNHREEKTEKESLEELKKKLKEAVKREEYEKAAALRDQIRAQEGINDLV